MAQQVKNPTQWVQYCHGCGVGLQLQLVFNPQPGNFHMPQEKKRKIHPRFHTEFLGAQNSQNNLEKEGQIWTTGTFFLKIFQNFKFFFFFFFWSFQGCTAAYGNSHARVESELQPLAYTTATATRDLSCVCDLYHSSQQRPLNEARD